MRRLVVGGAMLALMGPHASAQPLKTSDIIKNIEGVWGWPEGLPLEVDRSCKGDPIRIQLENNGTFYRSQQLNGGDVYESHVGLPLSFSSDQADYILISYINLPQPGPFGGQAVWALRMPDRDHFNWQLMPFGPTTFSLERCSESEPAS